jgi:two-component sensor histidine kinase/tetratricopeptide (TPR) repeat protein
MMNSFQSEYLYEFGSFKDYSKKFMLKSFFLSLLFCIVLFIQGLPQSSTQSHISKYTYNPPSTDKLSWQRLNLWLSSTFIFVVHEGQADQDVCLLQASRSLGLSRLPILAESIDDREVIEKSEWVDQQKPQEGIRLLSKTTGKQHASLLVLLGAYYAFQPNNYHVYKDSVEYFLTKAISESRSLKEKGLERQAYCLLAKMYFQANEFEKGDSVFLPLIKECQAEGDKRTEARAYSYRAIYEPFAPEMFQSKLADARQAADLYHELNDIEGEINMLTDVGYLLSIMSQIQPAYEVLVKALQLQEGINYPYTHYNTDILVFVTAIQKKFGEQLRYALQSIRVAETSRDSIGWAYFYGRMMDLYHSESGSEEKELEWAKRAMNRFLFDKDLGVYRVVVNITNRLVDGGNPQEALDLITGIAKKMPPVELKDQFEYHLVHVNCYNGLNKLELSEMHLLKLDSIETVLENRRGEFKRGVINKLYGSFYRQKGDFQKARLYFEKYFLSASVGQDLRNALENYRHLIYVDSALNDPISGLAHHKKYTALLDSNFRISKVRQAEELQVLYQTQDKESQIVLLNEQRKLEQANLKQANLAKNLTIAGIIAILIIALLLYRQNKLKQKSNLVITRKNDQLQHLVTEKEWLLKEIHHRVKNNFQTVMGLLGTQAGYQKNEVAINAITDSQRRIQSMSLIHQKLYQSNNLSAINMPDYVHELVDTLSESLNNSNRVRFNLEIEPIELDLAHCIPLGLIMNEAITNSFKYAFPNGMEGLINISFENISENILLLAINDSGIGLPHGFNIMKSDSMGMNLMRGLSEEIGAQFKIDSQKGTRITVLFKYDPDISIDISQKEIHSI